MPPYGCISRLTLKRRLLHRRRSCEPYALQVRQADLYVVQHVVVLLARLGRHEQERGADLLRALAAAPELLRDRLVGGYVELDLRAGVEQQLVAVLARLLRRDLLLLEAGECRTGQVGLVDLRGGVVRAAARDGEQREREG